MYPALLLAAAGALLALAWWLARCEEGPDVGPTPSDASSNSATLGNHWPERK